MAQCKMSPHEFIQNAFRPTVAVLCSPDAEALCQKNNLTFAEMVQPFCRLNSEAHVRDPNGAPAVVRNFRIVVEDMCRRPPHPTTARKLLNEAVAVATVPERTAPTRCGMYDLELPQWTPWFESWRECFLQVQPPYDHEFTKHYLACLLVVSSGNAAPLEELQSLHRRQHQTQTQAGPKDPRWFGSTLIYSVLLHDESDADPGKAEAAFQSMKAVSDPHLCHLLRLNSRAAGTNADDLPDPWSQFLIRKPDGSDGAVTPNEEETNGEEGDHPLSDGMVSPLEQEQKWPVVQHGGCLTTQDLDRIRALITDFCTHALFPHAERQIRILQESVANRKGVSRSIFSATKRWFGAKPGSAPGNLSSVIYTPEAPELQVRRLGDLCFMFGHYLAAYQAYHWAKRDFNADQAWMHYAGALEMAALSVFMGGEQQRPFPQQYLDDAVSTYLGVCRAPQLACRAALLGVECLRSRGQMNEAALLLVRMTAEEADLRSALLLEQAAHCFLAAGMARKYAFHAVLAGHRFSKAGQRGHALRAYKQAFQVYYGRDWSLASDHIHFTTGRLSYNLKMAESASESFKALMYPTSKQLPGQQASFLKEYLSVLQELSQEQPEQVPDLPIPKIDSQRIQVLVSSAPPNDLPPGETASSAVTFNSPPLDDQWHQLELNLMTAAQGSPPLIFKPAAHLFTDGTSNSSNPIVVCNEPIRFQLPFWNFLQIPLTLSDVGLVWTCESGGVDEVETGTLQEVELDAGAMAEIVLQMRPKIPGKVKVHGVRYTVASKHEDAKGYAVRGIQTLDVRGPRLNSTPAERCGSLYGPDLRLELTVIPPMPRLQVSFSGFPTRMQCGQVQVIGMRVANRGGDTCGLRNLWVGADPSLVCISGSQSSKGCFKVLDSLAPAEERRVEVWVRAPDVEEETTLRMVMYYESEGGRARVDRHSSVIEAKGGLRVRAAATRCLPSDNGEEEGEEGLNVALQVRNCRGEEDVNITRVSSLGKGWVLSEQTSQLTAVLLKAQEECLMSLKAHWQGSLTGETVGDISLSEDSLNSLSTTPRLEFCRQWLGDLPTPPMTLIVAWSSGNSEGQHHSTVILNETTGHNVVSYGVTHQRRISHSFRKRKVCVVPVTLHLQNCSDSEVVITVDAVSPRSLAYKNRLYSPKSSQCVRWVGRCVAKEKVEAHKQGSVALRAAVSRPGTYDLAGLQVSCSVGGEVKVQAWQLESTLVVTDVDGVSSGCGQSDLMV